MKPERRRPFPERRRLNREGIVSENLESLRLELSDNCIDGLLICLIGIIGGDRSILLIAYATIFRSPGGGASSRVSLTFPFA
jgi:hypothetical protein